MGCGHKFRLINLGYVAAVDPAYARFCRCDRCNVVWQGCDDERQCIFCGRNCLGEVMDHPDNPEGQTYRGNPDELQWAQRYSPAARYEEEGER